MSGFENSSAGRPGFNTRKRAASKQATADHDCCGDFAVFVVPKKSFSRDPKGSAGGGLPLRARLNDPFPGEDLRNRFLGIALNDAAKSVALPALLQIVVASNVVILLQRLLVAALHPVAHELNKYWLPLLLGQELDQ